MDPLGLAKCFGLVRYKKDKVTPLSGSYASGINRAWAEEKRLVQLTGGGTVNWTEEEKVELLSAGKVKGYTGHHINNAAAHPDWKGDPRNIVFLTNSPGGGAHLNSSQGHRGAWSNSTSGRLIDRSEMVKMHEKRAKEGCST